MQTIVWTIVAFSFDANLPCWVIDANYVQQMPKNWRTTDQSENTFIAKSCPMTCSLLAMKKFGSLESCKLIEGIRADLISMNLEVLG